MRLGQTFDPLKRMTVEDALHHPYVASYVSAHVLHIIAQL